MGSCRTVWNGKALIEEVDFNGPTGRIEGLMVRLYNPQSHQWSLNWVNAAKATFDIPTIGSFKDGVGEFGLIEIPSKHSEQLRARGAISFRACQRGSRWRTGGR